MQRIANRAGVKDCKNPYASDTPACKSLLELRHCGLSRGSIDIKKDELVSKLLLAASKSDNPSATDLFKVIQDGIRLQDEQ